LGVSDKGDTKHAVLGVLRDRIKKALVPRLFLDTRSSLHPVLILWALCHLDKCYGVLQL